MKATPNEIEQIMGFSKNSLIITEELGKYEFNLQLTSDQKDKVINLINKGISTETLVDWKQFRRGMWADAGFKRLTKDTSDRESKEDLKIAAAVGTTDWGWIKTLWDACVDGLTTKPTSTEINRWKTITSAASMPFSFGTDGKMILT